MATIVLMATIATMAMIAMMAMRHVTVSQTRTTMMIGIQSPVMPTKTTMTEKSLRL
ncbi:hypothetical protein BO71DRAFT_395115, partial [Aspergillus ellipticus CBS 707.79]